MKDNDLYQNVQSAKKNDAASVQYIIDRLEPKIKQTILSMEKGYQQDIEQEVKLRIMEAIHSYDTSNLPTLKEMLEKSKEGQAILDQINDDNY